MSTNPCMEMKGRGFVEGDSRRGSGGGVCVFVCVCLVFVGCMILSTNIRCAGIRP